MNETEQFRMELYQKLESRIGKTPLVEYNGLVPNGNRIWIKRECDNPFGSHYDRVYLALFQWYEEQGKIKPGDRVLETTSGTAGYSFAGIGRFLGYQCHVVIPEGVDKAIIKLIQEQEAKLHFTPEADYIAGFPAFLKSFLPKHRGKFTFLNHSMGQRCGPAYTNNEMTLDAMGNIALEIMKEVIPDYFIPAVGNGSSILGPGMKFSKETRIIAFESFQSAVAYEQKYSGEYKKRYGLEQGTLPRHRLRGTSFPGIDFPHIRNAITSGLIDDIILVSDTLTDQNYHNLTGRNDTFQMPHWDMFQQDRYLREFGRSTHAAFAVARQLAQSVHGKDMVIIAYDKAERYDY